MTLLSPYATAKARQDGLRKQFESNAVGKLPAITSSNRPQQIGSYGRSRRYQEAYGHFRSWVYAATTFIAQKIASQPLEAGQILDASANPDVRCYKQADLPLSFRKKSMRGDIEKLESHLVYDILDYPNPVQSKFEFLVMSALNLLITGESYWLSGMEDKRFEMWAIPTSWITPLHKGGLFTSYLFQPADASTPIEVDPKNVQRTFLVDPSDPKSAVSPLQAVLPSARVDLTLQTTQEQMFARGINPNLMITVGRTKGPDGKLSDRRPVLKGSHRRQLVRAVREIWGTTVNYGDPAIIDGLIESVHKLQATPQEMDFLQSGQIIKERIFHAYKVNDLVLGGKEGNRAQVVAAQKNACDNAINPLIDALSCSFTSYLGPLYTIPKRLVVFIEPCEPIDPELELRRWDIAAKNAYVTADEYRETMLDLPPREVDDSDTSGIEASPLVVSSLVTMLTSLGDGKITIDQATGLMAIVLGIPREVAASIVGTEVPDPVEDEVDDEIDDEASDDDFEESDDEEPTSRYFHVQDMLSRLVRLEEFQKDLAAMQAIGE